MKLLCLPIIILSLVGCSEKPVHESFNQEKLPELHRSGNDWVYEDAILSKSQLTDIIKIHQSLHIIAPDETSCKALKRLWEKSTSKNLKLQLSVNQIKDNTEYKLNSAEIHIFNDPLAERPDIEPMLVALRKKGLFINRELVTLTEFHTRMNEYASMAKAVECTPRFVFYFEDELSYGALVQFLENNENIKFEIHISDIGCTLPELIPQIEKPMPPSPRSRDLLFREPEGKIY